MTLDETRPAATAGLFEFAPAKINLALHVVGQRADGYHLLDSLVTFAAEPSADDGTMPPAGDRLHFTHSDSDGFSISGRFGADLPADPESARSNLVLKARDLLRAALSEKGIAAPPVAIHLEKNLPIASGIGGGSADAAATLRGLSRLWSTRGDGADLDEGKLAALALSLGADVPMCLKGEPLSARGIGEDIERLETMPSFGIVLGNPLVGVSTPEIFKRLASKNNPAIPPLTGDWRSDLPALRNDLEPPACALVADIAELTRMIAEEGAWLSRMSGSGATCFGLFDTAYDAYHAANTLQMRRPDWYFVAATTRGKHA